MASKDFVVKNGIVVDGTLIANATAIYYGTGSTNTTINTTSISVGNATSNTIINSGNIQIGSFWANGTYINLPGSIAANAANVASILNVGANININTVAIAVGNSTVNVFANATLFYVANSTSSANVSPAGFNIGSSFANSTAVGVGANIRFTSVQIFAGNTTVNSSITTTTASFNANTTTTALFVASNGNIGMGNTAPTDKLRVEGTASFTANVSGPGTTAYLDGFFIDCGVYS